MTTFYGLYFIHHLHILGITNHAGPSVWAVTHVLHSRHFLSWDMGTPHDAILVFCGLEISYIHVLVVIHLPPFCWEPVILGLGCFCPCRDFLSKKYSIRPSNYIFEKKISDKFVRNGSVETKK